MAAAASSRRSSSGPVIRSLSPSGRFCNSHYNNLPSPSSSSCSSAFASSTSGFASRSSTFFHRSASPTRVNLYGHNKPVQSTSAHSVRFVSPAINNNHRNRQVQVLNNKAKTTKKACMCSPTTHPGSFRCSLHKNFPSSSSSSSHLANYSPNNRLHARRSAMTNSLVRIGGVEGGDLVKRALAALIRPSSHQQRRRSAFQPRPSRLSIMSKAEDDL